MALVCSRVKPVFLSSNSCTTPFFYYKHSLMTGISYHVFDGIIGSSGPERGLISSGSCTLISSAPPGASLGLRWPRAGLVFRSLWVLFSGSKMAPFREQRRTRNGQKPMRRARFRGVYILEAAGTTKSWRGGGAKWKYFWTSNCQSGVLWQYNYINCLN